MPDLLGIIKAVRADGRQRQARCPAHDDRRASLSIGLGDDGQILVYCHAGCTLDAVLAAAELTISDLYTEEKAMKTPIVVAEYCYRDEQGQRLYDVVRFAPKDFRVRRADGKWTLRDVRRVLYRLPNLQGKRTVFFVEGEKAADRLHSHGLPATTSPFGADGWRDEYAKQFGPARVEHVVILPDNDDAGRRYAGDVALSCHGVGLKVKIIDLPGVRSAGDISDWLDAGHTRADLLALVKATEVWTPSKAEAGPRTATTPAAFELTSIADFLKEREEEDDYLVDGLISRGSTNLLSAKPKVGKSTLARGLALAVARGASFLGRDCSNGTVWYIALEGRRRDVRAHFRLMGATDGDPIRLFVGRAPQNVVPQVRAHAADEHPDLIIIDTMQRFLRAKSTDDYAEMTLLFDEVIGIANESGAAMLMLTHNSKAERAGLDAILGSTAIAGSVDTAILLTRSDRYRTILTVQRTGEDMPETLLLLDNDTGGVRLGGSRQQADQQAVADALLKALTEAARPLTQTEWLETVEARRCVKLAALKLVPGFDGNHDQQGVLRSGAGTKNEPFRYVMIRGDSGSHVPSKGGNVNPQSPVSSTFLDNSSQDSGSHKSTQGPASGPPEILGNHKSDGADNADDFRA